MRGLSWMGAMALIAVTPAMAQGVAPPQKALDHLAAEIDYRFEVVDNRPTCPEGMTNCFLATITLTLPDKLPASLRTGLDLSLFFSFVNPLDRIESDLFDYRNINGDVQQLTLKPGAVLRPGARHVVKLWGVGSHFSRAVVMPNAYLVAKAREARVIAATRDAIDPDTGLPALRFVASMTDAARLTTKSDSDKTVWLTPERAFVQNAERAAPSAKGIVILPRPSHAAQHDGELVDLTKGIRVTLTGVDRAAIAPALVALGTDESGKLPLRVRVDPTAGLAPESYRLDARADGIAITAADAAGASHGLRSLAQQAAFEHRKMRPLTVEDAPLYPHRGLHLDLGRNFHGRDQILKLVEAMAAYKLNKLHLHLAEDEGWRIEIPALPELAQIGSVRCHDLEEKRCLLPQLGAGPYGQPGVNGYLTTADYVAIVRAAAARGIEVIPSIDMPGHSRAAIVAMERRHDRLIAEGKRAEADAYRLIDPADTTKYRSIQHYTDNTLNVCIPSTYRFVDTVVDALAAMHGDAGAPLKTFHLGADETAGAWVNSPACKAMIADNGGDARNLTPRFIERVATGLAAKGIRVGGWSDGMGHTDPARMPANVLTNIWGVLHTGAIREAHDQLNRGWDVVLSIPDLGYFDMPYAPDPEEGGYYWASRGVDSHQVFGFMPDNLPANAALIPNISAQPQRIDDQPVREAGRRIAGIQAQLWSETVRSDAQVDYMLFPRLLALAERGWAPARWTPHYRPGQSYAWHDPRVDRAALAADWRDFAGRVSAQFGRLGDMGIAYRVAPPGARIVAGKLEANADFPGVTIEYRERGGRWVRYQGPVAVSGPVDLRSRSADGERSSRTVTVPPS
ncbi:MULTISPECIES: family 20 glycosylhydrolase [unclassified Sphingomonas]|uniref:family 20 glycosylhydrolase n=1 Tax=unclassified Sphingomonas TaxID=196159 RepID=UPI00215083B7|nr:MULTISPECIES: family 20 glycosylhydrolase [unclassified Sphingomonas]MCR5871195.1 carbohydate-binding domain-containing protein [Sphingomonas sp. J344]UUY00494.1 carbohydate-binding domain-containing protein [Sphingomonas sp. J315]